MAARVYIGWCKHKSEFGSTVEPRYLELGYLELPAISNYFLFSLAQINPGYLEL